MFSTEQYSLGSEITEEAKAAMEDAIKDGSKWVLKPQREGGGNNLYGAELSRFLVNNVSELGGKIHMIHIHTV